MPAITERSATLRGLGDWAGVAEPVAQLRGDLDAVCAPGLPATVDTVIRASIRRQLDALTNALLAPVRTLLADRDVVHRADPGALSTLPWGLLPDLHGRPVMLAQLRRLTVAGDRTRRARRPISRCDAADFPKARRRGGRGRPGCWSSDLARRFGGGWSAGRLERCGRHRRMAVETYPARGRPCRSCGGDHGRL